MRNNFTFGIVLASAVSLWGCGDGTAGETDAGRDATVDPPDGSRPDGSRPDANGDDDAGAPDDGGVPVVCGGFGGVICENGEYCDYADGCGFDDGTGVCLPRPDVCERIFAPVCGCDGATYGNACEAAAAGADVLHEGPCGGSPCAAQDARGEGACEALLGVAWDGRECVFLSGCSCAGDDCGALFAEVDDCMAAYGACVASVCGTRGAPPCRADQFCDFPTGSLCGAADGGGVCQPRPEVCPDIFAPVCACDGTTYSNSCDANAAGVDVLRDGACEGASCDPQDAVGVGACRLLLGYAWDGAACVAISGCECSGADCGALALEERECVAAHASCGGGSTCGGLLGTSCARGELCDYPDGSSCGAAGETGVCQPVPTACPDVVDPVCGCDGATHGNSCEAHAAGTDVAYAGACRATGGCNVDGCRGSTVCCPCTGLCYDRRCLSCCMFCPSP